MAEGGRLRGGICGLLDLIEEHPGALEYDFRTRFPGLPNGLGDVPDRMGWGEAIRVLRILRADPSSMVAAAAEGWSHPISREALALLDLYDLTMAANSSGKGPKPKPHSGRPFDTSGKKTQQYGNTGGRSRAEVVAILNARGHNLPV